MSASVAPHDADALHHREGADTSISAIEGAFQIRQAVRDSARCKTGETRDARPARRAT